MAGPWHPPLRSPFVGSWWEWGTKSATSWGLRSAALAGSTERINKDAGIKRCEALEDENLVKMFDAHRGDASLHRREYLVQLVTTGDVPVAAGCVRIQGNAPIESADGLVHMSHGCGEILQAEFAADTAIGRVDYQGPAARAGRGDGGLFHVQGEVPIAC